MKVTWFVMIITATILLSGCTEQSPILPSMIQSEVLPGETVPEGVSGDAVVITPKSLDGQRESVGEMDKLENDLKGVNIERIENIKTDE